MIESQNVIIASELEETISKLFPKHSIFYSLNTKGADILAHKPICLNNHLNWIGSMEWPNENTNEFLTHHLYEMNPSKFLTILRDDKHSLFYADLIDLAPEYRFEDLLSQIVKKCINPTMVSFDAKRVIDDELQVKIDNWSLKKFVIVDVYSNQNTIILVNYDFKNSIENPGSNATQRQQIKRKSKRWVNNLSELSPVEQDYILLKLVNFYINNKE